MTFSEFDFHGKTVFVAGGTSGINLGVAHVFAAAGASVVVCSRSPEKVDAAVEELRAHHDNVAGFAADVRVYEAIASALAKTHACFGAIDVLVSGAAGNFFAPALGMSSNGFRTVIDIDLVGTFNVMRAAHAFLRKPGASVINISADQAQRPMAMQVHACAAKAGVDQITRVLALEWAADGIRVNSVMPGPIEGTHGLELIKISPEAERSFKAKVPLQRFGSPAEVGNVCMFLSSSMAGFVTGVVLPVDGGLAIASGWNS